MAVTWIEHRFAGGLLALDVANTVVRRGDPRSFDRFADVGEIARFASAASAFRAEELGGRQLSASDPQAVAGRVIAIREATDALFRGAAAADGSLETRRLSTMLAACSDALAGHAETIGGAGRPFGDPARPLSIEAAVAVSSLSLLSSGNLRRLRVCPNCNWLFLDRSRNSSRLWCDMAVCGNRQKARRHYSRRKAEEVLHA
jgi:predicted RNA-binding Zn ribbon-like protein